MTIEIRQLVIRATAEARPGSPAPATGAAPRPAAAHAEPPAVATDPVDRDAIVAACVRGVLRELRRARER